MIGPGSLGLGILGAASIDPTQVVVWNVAGPLVNNNIRPGAGAALNLLDDLGGAMLIIGAGANGNVSLLRKGTGRLTLGVTGNPSFGNPVLIGSDSNDFLEIGNNGIAHIVNGTAVFYCDNTLVWQWRNAVSTVHYNGNGTDARWTRAIGSDRGDAATPGDGASADSPTYGLRIYNDPVGAPALESFDFTVQYLVAAGGGTADVDTSVNFVVRGCTANVRIFHDEGVANATAQARGVALILPFWDVSVDGVAGLPDGAIIYDSTGAAGNRFMGKHAGAWVALG